jgi:hypothetical protein
LPSSLRISITEKKFSYELEYVLLEALWSIFVNLALADDFNVVSAFTTPKSSPTFADLS